MMSDSTVMRRLTAFFAQSQDPSDSVVMAYGNRFLDTFVKRNLIEFFATHPDAEWTLPELETHTQTDRFILLGQLNELREAGLVHWRKRDAHTRVWRLASTEWVKWITRSVMQYWLQHPEKRNIIVHRTAKSSNPESESR